MIRQTFVDNRPADRSSLRWTFSGLDRCTRFRLAEAHPTFTLPDPSLAALLWALVPNNPLQDSAAPKTKADLDALGDDRGAPQRYTIRAAMKSSRTVYSTEKGRVCPTCGWPVDQCRCGERRDEAVPDKLAATLRLEKSGRAGKEVTVIDGLPRNAAFLDELARTLKRACGTGGSVRDGAIELQGDRRERAAALLRDRGIRVKGA